ncbi:kinase-like domain-containing protein [Rhizophagus irregularis DAOM 181602=DAOM 197198]|uniref:Kinase-like domain-containing protein n=1 Tax=Rhizophagus irregularis (strain DAOM 181602 / DAOM 197198 / MUCL 43194) TaxID=747089 RepID=A0A2P4QT80_RHIID|nr:kinase-like domain-containing protein [Rhizophagus irregularis DAOM 181602=DAOM 197198]POG80856.1 kinase-like domain-containing protein [Rhizophagus irregularis DAOM 181602=DAOM 197198]|eukprot:XP_025187722.1 kinase-like domain-containing protein [Rhizophagus irregularis DAOM 181602=DAOM 197198]
MDPFEKFELVKYVGKGGFSSVYSALWTEGPRWIWDDGAQIAGGLERIHSEGKIHRNLHGGNLLVEDEKVSTDARIADVGLHGPCNNDINNGSIQRYGVLPYVAPEVLRGDNCNIASDIYSFGIVMNTLATGKRPWYNRAHDINLAKDICDGEWIILICDDPNPSKISDENSVAEEKRWRKISQFLSSLGRSNIIVGLMMKSLRGRELHKQKWITFEKFKVVKYITKGGFSSIYSPLGTWKEEPSRWIWNNGVKEMTRAGPLNVTLKRLDSSQNISCSYINQWNYFLKDMANRCVVEIAECREEFIPKENLHGGNLIIRDESEPEKRPTASY